MNVYENLPKTTLAKTSSSQNGKWGGVNKAAVSIACDLRLENISHSFKNNQIKKPILQNISLQAKAGSITCLVGPSGSGKTSLLRIAAGLIAADEGEIYLDERKIYGKNIFVPPEQRGIGLVFQDYALFEHLTLLENVAFGLVHIARKDRDIVAKQMLMRMGLLSRAFSYPHDLSGGEQQRVALARALAPRPGVLLLDEPFSGLDARLRDSMREETWNILRETNATSLIITHDPEEALLMADKIALLNNGSLEQYGTPSELFFMPNSLFAASFFSPVNIFDSVVNGGRVATPLGHFVINDFSKNKFYENEKVKVVVRTNCLGVCACEHDHPLQARILDARFTGDNYQLKVGVHGLDMPLQGRVDCLGEGCASLNEKQLLGHESIGLVPDKKGIFIFKN